MSYRDDRDALLAQADALRRAIEEAEARADESEEARAEQAAELERLRGEIAELRRRIPAAAPTPDPAPVAKPPAPAKRKARGQGRAAKPGIPVPRAPWPPPRFGVPPVRRELDLRRPGTWLLLGFLTFAVGSFGWMIATL